MSADEIEGKRSLIRHTSRRRLRMVTFTTGGTPLRSD